MSPGYPGVEAPRDLGDFARALFEAIDDAVFVHDEHGNILEANPAACRRLGYTRDELLRLNTRDIDDPDFAAGFADRLRTQLQTGRFQCEGRHRTKDGRTIPVDINTSALEIDGRPAVLAVMRDITERKRAEEAAERNRQFLRAILNSMSDGIVTADAQGKLAGFNPVAERLLGPECRALFASAGTGLFFPDMETPLPPQQMPLWRALRGEDIAETEIFVRHPQAPQGLWITVTGGPVRDERAGLMGGFLVCRDVTERKRAESRRQAQYDVARVLAEGHALEESARQILQILCACLRYDMGALWVVNDSARHLECVEFWHVPQVEVPEFEAITRRTQFPSGIGLPGRVWATGTCHWLENLPTASNFPRAPVAARAGLQVGFAFPIKSGADTIGVLEFFNRETVKPDDDLVLLMSALGSHIGQVLERLRIEKALSDSEAMYHSLVEHLPQNIFRKDREGRVTFGNQRYFATLKRKPEELLGLTDFDLFPAELAHKYVEDDRRVMETGQVLELVEEHVLPDGSKIHVQVVKTPVRDGQGEIVGTQGMFWDVTERKRAEEAVRESEQRYRQLTEATQDGIVLADQRGVITLFNPAAQRMFGYSAAEVVGRPVTVLMAPEYQGLHERGLKRYLATRQSRIIGRVIEVQGRRKDGGEFPIEIALTALTERDGARGPVQFLAALRDLTERNRMRAILVQNEKLASIGLLSAGVAHEINNPLAFVGNNLAVLDRDSKGLMELLNLLYVQRHRLDPEVVARAEALAQEIDLEYIRGSLPRLLTRTRDGVERVSRIVQSLRGLARTGVPKKQDTYLPDLVEVSLEILRGKVKRLNIDMVQDHDPLPRVACVASQISQVLLNLLVNAVQAIEAAKRPHGRIEVRTRRQNDDMLIEIIDNGCGIDPAIMNKIFDPFFTTKDVGEGTGLGLSISHNIVTAHGGRMEVDSRVAEGSRFSIYLPLRGTSGGAA